MVDLYYLLSALEGRRKLLFERHGVGWAQIRARPIWTTLEYQLAGIQLGDEHRGRYGYTCSEATSDAAQLLAHTVTLTLGVLAGTVALVVHVFKSRPRVVSLVAPRTGETPLV